MPIYEYRCSKCGKTFEKIQKFVDPPVEVHEECGGVEVQACTLPTVPGADREAT